MKTALISGVTGQTGAYLAHYLLQQSYRVIGGSRDAESANILRLKTLGILGDVELVSLAPADFRSVLQVLRTYNPDQIYNLAGQTSVGLSFEQPFEAFESIATGTLNFLEAIRLLGTDCHFFNAGSTECFGNSSDLVLTEASAMQPMSPYAVAKATSYWITRNYRAAYGIHASTGLLSNHESPLRPARFVTRKIVNGIRSIQLGQQSNLVLGNIKISRDWGWAPDFVEAIHLICSSKVPDDYIVATGKTHSLLDFIGSLSNLANLDISRIVKVDDSLLRPSDLMSISVSPAKIKKGLGWEAKTDFSLLVEKLFNESLF